MSGPKAENPVDEFWHFSKYPCQCYQVKGNLQGSKKLSAVLTDAYMVYKLHSLIILIDLYGNQQMISSSLAIMTKQLANQ